MGCGFHYSYVFFLIITLQAPLSFSVNPQGYALLKFRERVNSDPHGTLANWNVSSDLCSWSGVTCVDGNVQILDLSGCSLGGTLAPELNQLIELRSLKLSKNHFSGEIPKEYESFSKLEFLGLRDNDLTGTIPPELTNVLSLKHLLLSGNKFQSNMSIKILRMKLLHSPFAVLGCANRKLGHCISRNHIIRVKKIEAFVFRIKATSRRFLKAFPSKFDFKRRELLEETSNLAAEPAPQAPSPSPETITEASPRSSGSFPAVTNAKKRIPPLVPPPPSPDENTSSDSSKNHPQPQDNKQSKGSKHVWLYVVIAVASFLGLLIIVAVIFLCRKRAVKSIGPWKTGLSGQLQKAFVTGVPKLNRAELETACEDFSNIIETFDGYTVYKGTLSSGVEIAVASTAVCESKEWTRAMEMAYRRKIDALSRINHKNFVNLIGYCEEDEPFNRMMVFEYAPNGTLFEHLHDKEMEHLDWSARMRIIMGTAYCLQHMHEMNPPMAHSDFNSSEIYLTDDYAAKVSEIPFNLEARLNPKKHVSGDLEQASLLLPPEPETNVHSFGLLMLEIISGKLSFSDEYGSIEQWASKHLENDGLGEMIDPSLKTFKEEELEVICDVIRECLKPDQRHRPSMKDVAEQLKQVINITPEKATPRSSPLWWAELEILSSEAT
ncbi:PREDICTED: probable LRR receptor-like serine/threonine-protein kinase MRH1 [Brassica oleracea var. oleracea]|uniref:Protein kinase domain-containing protein n=1 Tax=Brassica oleracea var. oleracea TaxID=109376 RepID=A0A0D3A455_BRAOL|nr:PREDICTED: probable LRR receptor-like serine/threonine-protein kinase MRH1 [Brassica oleracea var. oleracea]